MNEESDSSTSRFLDSQSHHTRLPTDDIYPVQSIYGELQGLTPPPEESHRFVAAGGAGGANAARFNPYLNNKPQPLGGHLNAYNEPPSPPRTDRSSPAHSSPSRNSISTQGTDGSPATPNPNTPESYAAMENDVDISGLSPDILIPRPVAHTGTDMPTADANGDLDLTDFINMQDFTNDNNPFFDFNSAASSPKPAPQTLSNQPQQTQPLTFTANGNGNTVGPPPSYRRRSKGHMRTDSNVSRKRSRDEDGGEPQADFHHFPVMDTKVEQPWAHLNNGHRQVSADNFGFQPMEGMQMAPNYSNHSFAQQNLQQQHHHHQLPPYAATAFASNGSFQPQYQLSVDFPKHMDKGPGNPNAPPVKSRVETQIAVRFTMNRLPENVTKLRLPRHTISKIKYIEDSQSSNSPEVLELEATVVCASAMQVKDQLERALCEARGEPVPEWVIRTQNEKLAAEQRASAASPGVTPKDPTQKDEKKTKIDYSIPLFGAPVAICEQCINRERKRAGRKKNKKPEEEKKWAEDEKKRIVLFNTNQIRQFDHVPGVDGAMFAETQMRLCCYCRHHGEKDGFQVIFTIRDYLGRVIAQTISDTILITDDHKNHPAAGAGSILSPTGSRAESAAVEKPPSHALSPASVYSPMSTTSAQIAQSVQAPAFGFSNHMQDRNMGGHSHPSTPSRQSPAPQVAPQTKRRRGSKVPATLTMTPSDTSGMFNASQFGNPFDNRPPNHEMNTQQWLANPTTPMSQQPQFGADSAFFGNMTWSPSIDQSQFARMKSPAASHMSLQRGYNQPMQGTMMSQNHGMSMQTAEGPQVARVVPSEGTCRGGIEVTVLGRGFVNGLTVLFGDTSATDTVFFSDTTLLCRLPPNPTPGAVVVSLKNLQTSVRPDALPIFTYVDDIDRDLMALALTVVGMKMKGGETGSTKQIALSILRDSNISTDAIEGRGGSNQLADSEAVLLQCLDTIDMDESPHPAKLNHRNRSGQTMLHLACMLGMQKFVAGLLARGANPNIRDKNGYTPLHFAALFKKPDVVRRLLINRANPGLRTRNGETAADLGEGNQIVRATRSVQQTHSRRHSRSSSVSSESHYEPSRASIAVAANIAMKPREAVDDFYHSSDEDDDDDQCDAETVDTPEESTWPITTPRRNSVRDPAPQPDTKSEKSPTDTLAAPESPYSAAAVAMLEAWREQFTQSLTHSIQSLQLNMPALPAAAQEYQAMIQNHMARLPNPMAKRKTAQPPAHTEPDYKWSELFHPPAPPPYTELYPNGGESAAGDVKEPSVEEDVRETEEFAADEDGRYRMLDAHSRKMKRIESDRRLYFFWIPMLLVVMMLVSFTNGPQLWATIQGVVDIGRTFLEGPVAVRGRLMDAVARVVGVPG